MQPVAYLRDYRPSYGYGGLGATYDPSTDTRYIPTPAEILAAPKPGGFYRITTQKADETWYGVAKRAYGDDLVKTGLLAMNASTWNDHINRKEKGWTAYKVKGLQDTPDYSEIHPHAPVLTGHAHPVVWIPLLDSEGNPTEPEQVYKVPTPVPGGPTNAEIEELIKAYLEAHPPPAGPTGPAGKTGAKGAKGDPGEAGAPGAPGVPGEIGPTGKTGAKGAKGDPGPMGPAGPPATEAQIAELVTAYLEKNPPAKGDKGDPGPQGIPGIQGPKGDPGAPGGSVSSGQIQSAVQDYMASHPVSTPAIDWSVVDDKISKALSGFTPGTGGTSTVSYITLLSAGVLGAAAMLAMAKRRRA